MKTELDLDSLFEACVKLKAQSSGKIDCITDQKGVDYLKIEAEPIQLKRICMAIRWFWKWKYR